MQLLQSIWHNPFFSARWVGPYPSIHWPRIDVHHRIYFVHISIFNVSIFTQIDGQHIHFWVSGPPFLWSVGGNPSAPRKSNRHEENMQIPTWAGRFHNAFSCCGWQCELLSHHTNTCQGGRWKTAGRRSSFFFNVIYDGTTLFNLMLKGFVVWGAFLASATSLFKSFSNLKHRNSNIYVKENRNSTPLVVEPLPRQAGCMVSGIVDQFLILLHCLRS